MRLIIHPAIERIASIIKFFILISDSVFKLIISRGITQQNGLHAQLAGGFQQRIMQINKPLTMRRRNRHRFAKPQTPAFGQAGNTSLALAFIGKQHNMRAGFSDFTGEKLVNRCHTSTRINHQQRDIGITNRHFSLATHAVLKRIAVGIFQTGRINHTK